MKRLLLLLAPAALLAAPNAYIGHISGNQIDSVDTATNTVNSPITVGNAPAFLAVTQDGSTVYVSNNLDGTVSIVDATLMTPMTVFTQTVGVGPGFINIAPDDSAVYVCDAGGTTVSWFDRAIPPTMSGTLSTGGGSPNYVTFSPDGSTGYIVDRTGDAVIPFSTTLPPATAAPIPLPGGAMAIEMVITPDGNKAYVTESGINQVAVIDFTMGNMVTQISTNIGSTPQFLAMAPDGSKVVVANTTSANVSVIDTGTDMATLIMIGPSPFYPLITPDSKTAFISSFAGSQIFALDLASNSVTPIMTGASPSFMAFTPDGTKLFVATFSATTTTVVDMPGYATATLSPILPQSYWIQILPPAAIPVAPPNLQGYKSKNAFLLQTDLINVLTWSASAGATSYRIYTNAALTDLLATIPSTAPLRYEAHNIGKHQTVTYYVVAVNSAGSLSAPATLTIAR